MNRPHVLMISEITTDGKLTLGKGISSKILMKYMSHEAEVMLHETRAAYDAIMVGSNTIRIDNSNLTVRLVQGKSPIRIVPNAHADLPIESNVFNVSNAPTILVVAESAPADRVQAFRDKGVTVVTAGKDTIDFPYLMDVLATQHNIKSLIVEGGPTLNWHMIHNNLVDEIRLIHMPFIVGGEDTPSLVGGKRLGSENEMIRLELKSTKMVGTNLVTEYTVCR